MKTGHYSISDILTFQNLDQLIVPEIQRDYVWGIEDVRDLLNSFREGLKEKEDVPYLGFIYAYSHKDFPYKYFLIDGQQRMTTIFLLLLACHRILGRKLPTYLIKDEKLKLDYKVRQATHDFLKDLVTYPVGNGGRIEDQLWYHNDYANDETIQNLIRNYEFISEWLKGLSQKELTEFLKLIEDEVGVSYFDVDNGRQGEELYIYMNSRGRQLEPNETLKAKFLSFVKDTETKLEWGKKWEIWQDFFWKHRSGNPDADHGFNEFLRRIQLINMCVLNRTSEEITGFATGRSNLKLDMTLLPNTLDEIDNYFEAYKFLVESDTINNFFKKQSESSGFLITTPVSERRQVFYLRILPLLALVARTGLRNEESIIRFLRFFYNVARKLNVGKDIATQLPISIRLIIEYTTNKKGNLDVTDFEKYQKGRTVLIDDEEVVKFYIYKNPPKRVSRADVEETFWKAEDHEIFRGEIDFLLSNSVKDNSPDFDLENFKKDWRAFQVLFPQSKSHNREIVRALLFYGNTWIKHTPNYYYNYKCDNWSEVIRSDSKQYLLQLIVDMRGQPIEYLDQIFKEKSAFFFAENSLQTIDNIKSQEGLFNQVRILSVIDFYSGKKLWNGVYHIAQDDRYSFKAYKDEPFFLEERLLYNVQKYINDGWQGRIIPMMKNVLQDNERLKKVLDSIFNQK